MSAVTRLDIHHHCEKALVARNIACVCSDREMPVPAHCPDASLPKQVAASTIKQCLMMRSVYAQRGSNTMRFQQDFPLRFLLYFNKTFGPRISMS